MLVKTTIFVVVFLVLSFFFYRRYGSLHELDHFDDRIRFGYLICKSHTNIVDGSLNLTSQKIFNLTYENKQVFIGNNDHFLTLMKAKGEVNANGDSFYDVSDEPEKVCKLQVIQRITSQNKEVKIEGKFSDCPDSEYQLTLSEAKDLNLRVKVFNKDYNRLMVSFYDHQNHTYYGLGTQYSYLSLGRDRPYSMLVREKGVGRSSQPLTTLLNFLHGVGGSYYTTYCPAPLWFSSTKLAYYLNSTAYTAWMNNKVMVWASQLTTIIISRETYKQLVTQVAEYNGYTKKIPDWINQGAIVGLQGGTESVKGKYAILKKAGAKISGLWLQDWVSKRMSKGFSRLWWVWELDQKYYSNWDQMREQLEKDNVSLLIYVNPMITNPVDKPNHRKNYYQEGIDKNVFIKMRDGRIFETGAFSDYTAAMIDFEKEEGIQFFKTIISNALNETGARGMMVDFSQAYPIENMDQTIEAAIEKHNAYPTLYHSKVKQIMDELLTPNNDFYIFTRAGYLGSPKYAHSLWAGDQNMNFDFHTGLPSCLAAILSSGLSGYAHTHCDIGGYTQISTKIIEFSQRTEILMLRWMQLSAFTAVFRSHEGNNPDGTIHVYSTPKLANNFAFYSRVFSILAKYRKQESQLSALEKLPLTRPMFLELDGMKGTKEIQDQFFLGSQMLIAPLLTEGNERDFFLPKGEWVSIWDRKIFKGCNCHRIWNNFMPVALIKTSYQHSKSIVNEVVEAVEQYKEYVLETVEPLAEDL